MRNIIYNGAVMYWCNALIALREDYGGIFRTKKDSFQYEAYSL